MSNVLLSNELGALVDKTKGDMKNRRECSGAHLANKLRYSGVVLAGGLGYGVLNRAIQYGDDLVTLNVPATTKETIRNAKGLVGKLKASMCYLADKVALKTINSKVINKLSSSLGEVVDKHLSHVIDAIDELKGMSKNTKAGAFIAFAGFLTACVFARVHCDYKRGQIDQKYTDKAKLESLEKESKEV